MTQMNKDSTTQLQSDPDLNLTRDESPALAASKALYKTASLNNEANAKVSSNPNISLKPSFGCSGGV